MITHLELLNYLMMASSLMLMLLGVLISILTRGMDRWSKRFFVLFFSVLGLYVVSILLSFLSEDIFNLLWLSKLAMFLESLFSAMLVPLLTLYLLHCSGEAWQTSLLLKAVFGLYLVYLALLIATQFTTQIYYFTPEDGYQRGPWYPLLLVPSLLTLLLNLAALFRRRSKLSRKQFTAFLVYMIVPALATLIQMWIFGLLLVLFATTIGAMVLFFLILSEQMEQYDRQQEENARQRASILVLQMRPHFIYNTMTSIYYLCGQDPQRARQVILDFTSYLRKNLNAIAGEGTISFAEELEHARAYLAVEQVRFEGELFVEFDTPHTAFRLPPLTLQPIVENAVKHGVDPELDPLHLTVRTRYNAGVSEILVEDTGPGYSPAQDGEPHLALANIRERLKLLCKGTLEIGPREGGGTRVTVRIPQKNAEA